jgi:hypothetical protein
MLDRLSVFCSANSMFVNMEKSEVVVYGGGQQRPTAVFTYNGASLPIKSGYVYLGMKFEDGQPTRAAITAAVTRARKAVHAVQSRCHALKIRNVHMMCHLFDALVVPVLNYGCEVWGVDWVSKMCKDGDFATGEVEEAIHRRFLRQCLGVCKSTTTAVMYQELGRRPISMSWLRMAAQLWNRALSRRADDWLRVALMENVRLAGDPSLALKDRKSLWAWHFIACMDSLGLTWRSTTGVLLEIPRRVLCDAMRRKWEAWERRHVQAVLGQNPTWAQASCTVRAAPASFSKGFKLFVYERWFAVDKWVKKEHWSYWLQEPQHIRVMAQFRMGSHWLEVQRGRGERAHRAARRCRVCSNVVEDELHVFECPLYADIRNQAGSLPSVWADAAVRKVMNKKTEEEWRRLADFLVKCRDRKLSGDIGGSAPRVPSGQGA